MPRYHISVLNDSSYMADEQGVELPDFATASRQAKEAAGGIISEELIAGREAIHLTLAIDDDSGRRLAGFKIVTTMTVSGSEGL